MQTRFFLDFDGTVSNTDVVDLVLDKFASPAWQLVEKEWANGKIGSRECLSRQLALVTAEEKEILDLIDTVKVDAGFESFLKTAELLSVPVAIVSDGFDLFIHRILKNNVYSALLKNLPVFANQVACKGGHLQISFPGEPCEHGCANCKPAVLKKLSKPNDLLIFVGDGLSDRFAARVSVQTFAKGKLLPYCQENRLRHRAFEGFHEIEDWLKKLRMSQVAYDTLHHSKK
jgi:2-hydroxy-3-keto-5-methylthiopentenyl-1-phosphate phosphatase